MMIIDNDDDDHDNDDDDHDNDDRNNDVFLLWQIHCLPMVKRSILCCLSMI